jgi:hypothetical protein
MTWSLKIMSRVGSNGRWTSAIDGSSFDETLPGGWKQAFGEIQHDTDRSNLRLRSKGSRQLGTGRCMSNKYRKIL